jgi:uncharacterized protein YaaQ
MEEDTQTILLLAIVQAQDVETADEALRSIGIFSSSLPSFGGFLGRKNTTLLIPVTQPQVEPALEAIRKNCRQRVEYIAVPLESAPLPLPTPTPVTVGGATIFNLEIEHYEEI